MLNEEARKRAERYLEISKDLHPAQMHFEMTTPAFQWLAQTLIEVDNRTKEHKDCCLELTQLKEYAKKYSREEDIPEGATFKAIRERNP